MSTTYNIKKEVDTDSLKKDPRFKKLARKIAVTSFPGLKWLRIICFNSKDMDLLITVFEKIYSSDMSKEKNYVKNLFFSIICIAVSVIILICSVVLFFKSRKEDFNTDSTTIADSVIENNKELHEDVVKAKNAAIADLKRLGLIGDYSVRFAVDDFRKIRLSLKNNDLLDNNIINDICQIYAYELAVVDYDLEAVNSYYKGIKCRYDDRYFEGKDDFVRSIGFENTKEYESFILESIENKNGEIGIGGSSMCDSKQRSTTKNGFRYNGEDRGISLCEAIRLQKQEQSKNMAAKAMGSYKARRYSC